MSFEQTFFCITFLPGAEPSELVLFKQQLVTSGTLGRTLFFDSIIGCELLMYEYFGHRVDWNVSVRQ